jgi:hypothetical protein
MRINFSYAAAAALAIFASTACTASIAGPTVLSATPQVSDNGDGTFNVNLIVDFDDSDTSGDLVDEYTFQTDDGQVDDVDVLLPTAVASPFTIAGLTLPADDNGQAALGFHLILFGASTGEGSQFDGVITVN